MKAPIRLRIHVSEPFDFERANDACDLYGATHDHHGDADEWLVELDGWYRFNDADYDTMLVAPRYVGEHLSRVFDSFMGVPVRIAHRTPEGWHFAMTGMLSVPPPDPDTDDGDDDDNDLNDLKDEDSI